MRRAEQSQRRRAEILEAALSCFQSLGYERTTMADIRVRAGASTGSIYHHFKSREQLSAALYLDAVRGAQQFGLRALRRQRDLESGLRALVASYLRWVSRHSALARHLLTLRRAELATGVGAELERLNRDFRAQLRAWLERHAAPGALPALEPDVLLAILIGPSEEFARRWLRGATTTPLRRAADQLADAAWRALASGAGAGRSGAGASPAEGRRRSREARR